MRTAKRDVRRISSDFEPDLYIRLKTRCAKDRISMRTALELAVSEFLNKK